MSRSSSTIEERLANYRPTLDDAIARGTSPIAPDAGLSEPELSEHDLVELDWQQTPADRASNGLRLLLATAAVAIVVVGGLATIVATRRTSDEALSPASPLDAQTATSASSVAPVVDTALAGTVQGTGATPACPDGTGTIGTGTLYLGGPAWEQNLAAKGFIFSLPSGTAPVDVAVKAIALPVVGLECGISGTPNADGSVVSVTVDPPAVPTALRIEVAVSERAGAIGVTGINSGTTFEINNAGDTPSLKLFDGMPASATSVHVRFKKGDDVWELTADPTVGNKIALIVPSGETDRFAAEPVDWVLFTVLDADDHLVGVGGAAVS